MYYIFMSSLDYHGMPEVVASYDIACQWSRNLRSCHQVYGVDYSQYILHYLIPKFHLNAHEEKCQIEYSFNYYKGVGRTDGEAVEHGWAAVNPVATSTKEMGAGHRHDVLDDVFGAYNWDKVRKLGAFVACCVCSRCVVLSFPGNGGTCRWGMGNLYVEGRGEHLTIDMG